MITLEGMQNGAAGIRFSVTDTGIGVALEQLHRLCQPFKRADGSTTRRYAGTGPRLAICKSLAGLIGGSIRTRCIAAGMDDYLGKPIDIREVTSLLRRWLRKQRPA